MRVRGAICRQCAVFVYVRTKADLRACPGGHMIVGKPPASTRHASLSEPLRSAFARPDHPPLGTEGDGFHRSATCDLPMTSFVPASGDVRTTAEALHYDWSNRIDKFGIIPAPAYRDFNVAQLPVEPPALPEDERPDLSKNVVSAERPLITPHRPFGRR